MIYLGGLLNHLCGTGTRLKTRKFPANSDQEHIILSKSKTLRDQYVIEYDLITADSIKAVEGGNSFIVSRIYLHPCL